MKVKFDFISNSSSTSFVYISDEELNEEAFFEAVGVDREGPVGDLFYQMYNEIKTSLRDSGKQVLTKEDAESFAAYEFTPDVVNKMKDAIEQGKIVTTSKLSSDGSLAESLLCVSMFEVESDSFYINAYNNVW
ncbi:MULTISPECIES: hypothetical protein [Vibrio]|uniref:hypothetical protein n=1 Tax=Vibrio TaxID=662 RepID=UPI0006345376|nr:MULTISPECIES: hypothetical protein [Vibrio]MBN8093630.1 hypothetical protein [Vibrio vulnificus]TCO05895.1 hypothetical protein EDB30_102479 [Vibrio crassostreae]TCT50235.1 hypothetical protein EDB42_10858 [Vibrio crassostreae]TCT65081.1 hypothetical protein EDB31_1246 [Vibrio crassostreae]TCT75317.1 hypothetical protein EDB41_108100 [Vibrio crassostreae]